MDSRWRKKGRCARLLFCWSTASFAHFILSWFSSLALLLPLILFFVLDIIAQKLPPHYIQGGSISTNSLIEQFNEYVNVAHNSASAESIIISKQVILLWHYINYQMLAIIFISKYQVSCNDQPCIVATLRSTGSCLQQFAEYRWYSWMFLYHFLKV